MVAMVMLVMVGLLYLSCSRLPITADPDIVVSGSVIDAASRRPIDSAWVVLGDSASVAREDSSDGVVYTDTAGSFVIYHFLPISEEILSAGKSGYITSSKVLKDIGYDTSGIVFELVRAQ
jgi:hypothetical protein